VNTAPPGAERRADDVPVGPVPGRDGLLRRRMRARSSGLIVSMRYHSPTDADREPDAFARRPAVGYDPGPVRASAGPQRHVATWTIASPVAGSRSSSRPAGASG
jgi:hypothetical protein